VFAEEQLTEIVNLSKPNSLYEIIYEAKIAKIITDSGAIDESSLIDVVKGIPKVKEFMTTNNLLIGDSTINYNGINAFLDANLGIRNLLVREGVLDSTGAYSPSTVKSIAERYNPKTKTLDPIITDVTPKKNTTTDNVTEFKLENESDLYELVLKAYENGFFDQDGNFIQAAFKEFMASQPTILNMLKTEKICDAGANINFIVLQEFVENRPNLLSLLESTGIYKNKEYSAKAVSNIILKYDSSSKKLDTPASIPVVDQLPTSNEAKAESVDKMRKFDDSIKPGDLFKKLLKNPGEYIRDVIAFGRRNGVFDVDGNFDYFTFYNLIASDSYLQKISDSYKIFDGNGSFSTANLMKYVNDNKELRKACVNLGILDEAGQYSRETVLGITSNYQSQYERTPVPFQVFNPASCNTVDDVYIVLNRAYTMKIIDDAGNIDIAKLNEAMNENTVLKENIQSYGVINGNELKTAGILMTIRENPLLRRALVSLGILDSIGAFDSTAFQRAIARSKSFSSSTNEVSSTASQASVVTHSMSQISEMEKAINDASTNVTTTAKSIKSIGVAPSSSSASPSPAPVSASSSASSTPKYSTSISRVRTTPVTSSDSNQGSSHSVNVPLIIICCIIGTLVVVAIIAIIASRSRKSRKPRKHHTDDDQYHVV